MPGTQLIIWSLAELRYGQTAAFIVAFMSRRFIRVSENDVARIARLLAPVALYYPTPSSKQLIQSWEANDNDGEVHFPNPGI
jgi:hypothetical protein